MPEWTMWLVRLALLGAVILLTVEVRRLRKQVSGQDAREARRARHAAETEQQVLDLLGWRKERRPNGDDHGRKRRRLWLLPPAALAVLAGMAGWVKHWSGPIAGAAAGAAAVTLFVISGSASSPRISMPDRPQPVPPITTTTTVRWPSSTSELPPLTTTTAPPSSTVAPTSTLALTEAETPAAAPPLPTSTTTVTDTTISKMTVTSSKTTSCLLRLELAVAGVCLD